VIIEREGATKTKAIHDGKADRIGQRVFVVRKLANDFASPQFVSEIGSDNCSVAAVQLAQNLVCLCRANLGQNECVKFGGYEVGGYKRSALFDQPPPQLQCGAAALVSFGCHGEER
jgi:hypothetical protein